MTTVKVYGPREVLMNDIFSFGFGFNQYRAAYATSLGLLFCFNHSGLSLVGAVELLPQ